MVIEVSDMPLQYGSRTMFKSVVGCKECCERSASDWLVFAGVTELMSLLVV